MSISHSRSKEEEDILGSSSHDSDLSRPDIRDTSFFMAGSSYTIITKEEEALRKRAMSYHKGGGDPRLTSLTHIVQTGLAVLDPLKGLAVELALLLSSLAITADGLVQPLDIGLHLLPLRVILFHPIKTKALNYPPMKHIRPASANFLLPFIVLTDTYPIISLFPCQGLTEASLRASLRSALRRTTTNMKVFYIMPPRMIS